MQTIIFRCRKKDEMYLYLPAEDNRSETDLIEALPDALLALTGELDKVMRLEITPDRKLARARAEDVLSALGQQGYYLQMPPNDVLRKSDPLHNPSDGF